MKKSKSFLIPSSIAGVFALALWAISGGNAMATAYTNASTSIGSDWTTLGNWNPSTNYPGSDEDDTLVVSGLTALSLIDLNQSISFASLTANANDANLRITATGADRVMTLDSIVANTSGSSQFNLAGEDGYKLSVSVGTLTMDSGLFSVGTTSAGLPLNGTFFATTTTVSGGTLNIGNLGGSTPAISDNQVNLGNLTMSGGSINISNTGTVSGYANFVRVNSLGGVGGNINVNANATFLAKTGTLIIAGTADGSFGGAINGSSTLALTVIKQGESQQTFTGNNTYTGGTTITAGSLLLSGSGNLGTGNIAIEAGSWGISGISASIYTLSATQTLSGAGTVIATGKTLEILGTLAPGNSPGQLTVDGGTLDISDAASLVFELGTSYDSVFLTNGADLDIGTLDFTDFNFVPITGFGAGTYTLFSGWDGLSGSLGMITGNIDGLDSTLSIVGNELRLDVIPEPSTGLLLGLAAGALLLFRGARRRG